MTGVSGGRCIYVGSLRGTEWIQFLFYFVINPEYYRITSVTPAIPASSSRTNALFKMGRSVVIPKPVLVVGIKAFLPEDFINQHVSRIATPD